LKIISGIVTALIIIIFNALLSKHISANLIAATILYSIAFIYVGFSLKENTVGSIVLEVFVAVVFISLPLLAIRRIPNRNRNCSSWDL
jgi:hypothetical protein